MLETGIDERAGVMSAIIGDTGCAANDGAGEANDGGGAP